MTGLVSSLVEREKAGLIKSRRHPDFPLTLWDYTVQCQINEAWDEVTTMTRGLVVRDDGSIVARPFDKFFNVDERPETKMAALLKKGVLPEIAEKVEVPPDRSYVEFTLNPKARFSDGVPVTADDVIFSYETLRDHGRPNHRSYYKKVARAEKAGAGKVRFTFDGQGDREMPLIMGLMPVLPKHLFPTEESFDKTTLEPVIGGWGDLQVRAA